MMNHLMPGARRSLTDVTQNMRKAIIAFLDNHDEDRRKLAAFVDTRLEVDAGKKKFILYDGYHHLLNIHDKMYKDRTNRLKKVLMFSSMNVQLEGLCHKSMQEFHEIKKDALVIAGAAPKFEAIQVKCEKNQCSDFPCDRRLWIRKVYANCKYCNESDMEYDLPDLE